MQLDLGRVRIHEKEMIIAYERPMAVKESLKLWNEGIQSAGAQAQSLAGSGDAEVKQVATEIRKHLAAYEAAFKPVVIELVDGVVSSATMGSEMAQNANGEFADLERQLQKLEELVNHEAANAMKDQEAAGNTTKWLFAVAVAITIIVVVPLTWLNMQAICNPLEQARGIAQSISQGDLSFDIRVVGKDEVSELLRSLEAMRRSLAGTVGDLRDASESIAAASSEIASGNQDLSTRTERAAANVQSMVSSITELLGTVQQTASSAQMANQLASAASNQATLGGQKVTHVVTSMHEISAASRKIGDIIGLIDSIAFQTNILALNAAVEAARAGEQGRGFAVVASEVRSLAQRSAQAANDVKGLIQASVSAVDSGVSLAEQAGTAMQEMVGGAQRVGGIIAEISSASSEQSAGISGVNETVHEIDQMTQQNAALVEQSAAAAQSLQEQATRLADVVHQFKLRSGTSTANPALRLT
jgi:methyl-accepting chemotaxis protein